MKLPHHWHTLRVRDLGRVVAGRTPPSDIAHCFGGEVPFITPGDLGRGKIVQSTERTLTENGVSKVNVVRRGSVFFTCIGLIGKTGQALSRSAFNQQINAIEPSEDFDDSFVFYLITKLGPYIARLAGAVTLPIVNKSEFCDFPISVPPLPEQRKIAAILSTWDEALEKLDSVIAAKERRKKALMHKLLTGKMRLKGFSCKWSMQQMPNVFERVERKATGNPQHVLSISAGKGFVDQSEKFSRVIAGRNLENYVLLRKGEFAYNKGNSDRYPQGCIYRLEEFEEGAVPNVWISFRLRAPTHSSLFYKHFFLAGGHNHQLHRLINAGVRNDGLLNLTSNNFFSIRVPVPPEKEQGKLGDMFESFACELRLLRSQRAALDQQKRGLMQRLLTGVIRVRLEKK